MKRFSTIAFSVVSAALLCLANNNGYYLFSYFTDDSTPEQRVRYAVSEDGIQNKDRIINTNTMLNEINWPERFLPGTTYNFASNEVIVKGLTIEDVWPYLTHIQAWDKYYSNCEDVRYDNPADTELKMGTKFSFTTFGFDVVSEVVEYQAPKDGLARLAWSGLSDGDAEHKLEVVHAWLLEELSGNRLRILTQESQIGKPAADMAGTNTMIDGHQEWLNILH